MPFKTYIFKPNYYSHIIVTIVASYLTDTIIVYTQLRDLQSFTKDVQLNIVSILEAE
jgi:hypothetical protein